MFTKALLLSALSALAAAQSSVLSFTHVPNPITDGQAQAITYDTNDTSSPVTIILRKGQSSNLQTISTLTSSATGGQYIWTPSSSLPDDDDYALEIKQGDQTNYYGPFTIEGSSGSSSSSSSASASATGYGGHSSSSASSSSASASAYSSSSANVTSTTVSVTAPYGTAPGSSMGTGTALPRNTTMSSATLSKTPSTPASATALSTATGATGATGTSTGAATAASSSSTNAASAVFGGSSSLALVFGAVAAVFYLQ